MSTEKEELLKVIDGRLGRCFDLAVHSAGYFFLGELLDVHLVYGIGLETVTRRRIAHGWVEFRPFVGAEFYLCFDPVMRSVTAAKQYYDLLSVEKTFRHKMNLDLCYRPPALDAELERIIIEGQKDLDALRPVGNMIVNTRPTD